MLTIVANANYYYLLDVQRNRTWKYRFPTLDQAKQVKARMEASWAKHPERLTEDLDSGAFIGPDDICTTVDEKFKIVKLPARSR